MTKVHRHALKATALAIIALMLTGCAVGPDFKQPEQPLPGHFHRVESTDAANAATVPPDGEFWKNFNDPQLSTLIEQALRANGDLRVALAHYDRANALLGKAKWDYFPTVTAGAQGGRERVSTDQSYGFPRNHQTYGAGIDVSWEFDLFGRVRRSVEAQRAEAKASAHDMAALQVAVVAETAATYAQLRGLQERLRVLRENVDRLRQMQQVVDARVNAGRGTDLDSTRALAQLETTTSRVPALEAQIAIAQHRLAVLTGRAPGALVAELDSPRALAAPPASIDPTAPAQLLRRRPDVAAAEERLHAATARVGVATADLFPRLSFGALIGTQAFHSNALFNASSESNHALLGVDWSFLDVGRVRARLQASDADATAQLASYQQTVLLALEDTENALVRYNRTRKEDEQLQQAARDSARSAELAQLRYKAGKIELFELLGAERDLLGAQDAFADCRTRSTIAAVALYKALAGGWPSRAPERLRADAAAGKAPSVKTAQGS